VLTAWLERADRQWRLLAGQVRTAHVHLVVENDRKSYASRCLKQWRLDHASRKRWARHGSRRWLRKPQNVPAAIRYVVAGQGNPMAVFDSLDR
jgi:hypothetical protein